MQDGLDICIATLGGRGYGGAGCIGAVATQHELQQISCNRLSLRAADGHMVLDIYQGDKSTLPLLEASSLCQLLTTSRIIAVCHSLQEDRFLCAH